MRMTFTAQFHDKNSQVPFRVSAEGFSKFVYLPIDMSASNPVLYGSDAFAASCDVQKESLSHNLLIALLLLGIMMTRRNQALLECRLSKASH